MASSSWFRVAILAVGVLACAREGVAQPEQRPPASRGTQDEEYRTTLMLWTNLNVGEGADPSGTDELIAADGVYTGGQVTLSFARRLRRVSFGAQAAKALRYYQNGGSIDLGDRAAVSVDVQLRRSRFTIAQTISRSPFQQLLRLVDGGDATLFALATPDLSVLNAPTTTLSTIAELSRPIGRRAEIQLRYGLDESRQNSRVDRRLFTAGGGVRRGLTRDLGLRLGYNVRLLRSDQQSVVPSFTSHDLDLGFDYHRALSFSRRSRVTFSSGVGAVTTVGTTEYIAIGSAALQHHMGRTWSAGASFGRRLNVIEGIAQPVVGNEVGAALGGAVGARASLLFRASMMRGQIGFSAPGGESSTRDVSTFTTQARLSFTLWRGLQSYAEHYYYTHEFIDPGVLSRGVPAALERRGVRTGLDLNIPVLRRRR